MIIIYLMPSIAKTSQIMEDENDANVAEGNKLTVTIHSKFFNCHVCDYPLEPPVFQCEEIHFVCGGCSSETAGKCTCSSNLTTCPALDAILQCATVCCPNSPFGCQEKYLYYDKLSHELHCPFDPNFFCPFGGCCSFQSATVEELASHVMLHHPMLWCTAQYDEEFNCTFCTNGFNCMLVAAEDGRCFLLVCESNADGFYVSLLCMGSKSSADDLCFEITADLDCRDVVWSITSSHMICIRRWMGINDKCRSLFLPSGACCETDDGELIFQFTVCIRKN